MITSVDSASAYGGYNYFGSGSWLEIKGTNMADPADPRLTASTNPGQWTSADFNGSNAPTSLDGISVSIDGKPAYVWYLSTGQINVQAPEDTTTGNVAVTVTNCKATSPIFTFARRALAPGFLAPTNYTANGEQYMVATFQSDGAYVLNTSTGAAFGLNSRPAKPGDGIIAYGIGFGDVTPSILPGVIVGQSNALVNPVTISFGTTKATIAYQGLAGGFVGLYEFYFTVPSTLANGDYQIEVTQNGTTVPQTMYLTVHN
ncbi:MAG TPA: IPT/TIG domain-containing protein [Bryobacteraceae bacterium]|nr:IPT/TIG domain-containing protein [Bryobacteraceae bacterium]